MVALWGSVAGLLLYLEIVYHVGGYGLSACVPVFTLSFILVWSGVLALLIGLSKGIFKKILFCFTIWFFIIWAGAQTVYFRIFKQVLLWEGIVKGGGDALSNYWREALEGIAASLPQLVLMVLPGIALTVCFAKKWLKLPQFGSIQILRTLVIVVLGVTGAAAALQIGKYVQADYYEDYTEFYAPLTVAETMGIFPMLQRDTTKSMADLGRKAWGFIINQFAIEEDTPENVAENSLAATDETMPGGATDETVSGETTEVTGEAAEEISLGEPHVFDMDFAKLRTLSDNEKKLWLTDYIEALEPDVTNEYTGIFKGYNLIYLTAEGFSPYAVREDLTPTLYRLIHSGFVFNNYYVPLWQTSTSDGEYINSTGLIPDGQFSMRKSSANSMPYTLPGFFAMDGVTSMAYHNNSLSYYDRYLTHPNLGYDFKGCKLGKLSAEEWGDKVFPMEHPDAWPASDLEMMQGTVSEYVNQERFHAYYMTVSGHMNYNFKGNAMSSKNREAVAGLEMSENARAYIACNIELDKALEYLLQQLEEAGQLERTVICMSADHYPYAMTTQQYEELAGKPLNEGMDLYRNNLILWNAGMEEEPVYVDKACGSMDIVPTLLNLFGFSYDSRMYAGRDILSSEEGMVIFNDRSFVTDSVIYNKKNKSTTWVADTEGNMLIPAEQQSAYFEEKKQEVKNRYQFSAYVLQTDYYSLVGLSH